MIKKIALIAGCFTFLLITTSQSGEKNLREHEGVVTLHILPAKLIQVNKIIENPQPGTSYIGDEGILVEIDENVEMIANWTVVKIRYYQYPEPKVILYKILSEEIKISVKYRAVDLKMIGDMSSYVKQ